MDWTDENTDIYYVKIRVIGTPEQPHPDLQRVQEGAQYPYVDLEKY